MRNYSNKIALIKNSRGVYSLDASIGCSHGTSIDKRGCYYDCYAAKSAKLYGYDFSKTVFRFFENRKHLSKIIRQINNIKAGFIRIGTSGDPSEDWDHTINICRDIKRVNKDIVIITKHWNNLTDEHLKFLNTINVCINTSVSALDNPFLLKNALEQYKRIKSYCKSVLRIVSADFNLHNELGENLHNIQNDLFKNEDVIDTILRVNKNNKLVKDGIINIERIKFLGKKTYASKFNKKTYFGKCYNCVELCGVRINNENYVYDNKILIPKQLKLF